MRARILALLSRPPQRPPGRLKAEVRPDDPTGVVMELVPPSLVS